MINWDGRADNGAVLENGVYYYKVELQYDTNDPKTRSQSINGWVQILR